MAMDLPHMYFFGSCLYLYIIYLCQLSAPAVRNYSQNAAILNIWKRSFEKMKTENDALETSINSSIDLNKI